MSVKPLTSELVGSRYTIFSECPIWSKRASKTDQVCEPPISGYCAWCGLHHSENSPIGVSLMLRIPPFVLFASTLLFWPLERCAALLLEITCSLLCSRLYILQSFLINRASHRRLCLVIFSHGQATMKISFRGCSSTSARKGSCQSLRLEE